MSERSEGTKVDSTGLLDSVAQHLKATMPDKGYGAAADAAMRELGLDPNKEFRLWTEIRRALWMLVDRLDAVRQSRANELRGSTQGAARRQ